MGLPGQASQRAHQVVLPSGRQVEVVYFGPPGPTGAPASDRAQIQVCPQCCSDFVYPTNWEKAGPRRWCVELRCPECEWTGEGIHGEREVERFDRALDEATEALLEDLQKLTRANMEAEIEAFVAALDSGLVLPEDF